MATTTSPTTTSPTLKTTGLYREDLDGRLRTAALYLGRQIRITEKRGYTDEKRRHEGYLESVACDPGAQTSALAILLQCNNEGAVLRYRRAVPLSRIDIIEELL